MQENCFPTTAERCLYTEDKNGVVVLQTYASSKKMRKTTFHGAYYLFCSTTELVFVPMSQNDGKLIPQQAFAELLEKATHLKEIVVIGASCGLIEDFAQVIGVGVRNLASKPLLNYAECKRIYEELFDSDSSAALRAKYDFVLGNVEGIYV